MKTFPFPLAATGGVAAWTPASRTDLRNWYRKGIGQTDSGGLTVWADQEGTANIAQVAGTKGTINGDGTVTWAGNGTLWTDYTTGFSPDFTGIAPPWSAYLRFKINVRDASHHRFFHVLGVFGSIGFEYRSSSEDLAAITINGSSPMYPEGSITNVVGPWMTLLITAPATGTGQLRISNGTPVAAGAGFNTAGVGLGGTIAGTTGADVGFVTIAELVIFHGGSVVDSDAQIDDMLAYFDGLIS